MEQKLIAGDSLDFTTTLTDYPASVWTLTHRLVPQVSGDPIDLVATASGDDHVTTATAAVTSAWEPGDYTLLAYVTNGAERHTLDVVELAAGELRNNIITILPDPSQIEAYDSRSTARRMLDAVEAVLANRATKDQEEYTIKDRSLKRTPIADLWKLRNNLRIEVANEERAAAGLGAFGQSYVRFNRV